MDSDNSTQDLNRRLRLLVEQALACPPDSPERRTVLTEVVRLVMLSKRLWRESTSYYPDALQEMWVYCFQNIDHPEYGYDPEVCTVITWLDDRLKKNLQRYHYRKRQQGKRYLTPFQLEEGKVVDPIDTLVAPTDARTALSLWNAVLTWVQEDPEQILRKRSCSLYPHINAQTLLLRHLLSPGKHSWSDIATELGAPKDYLAKWYNRHCISLLREWGRANKYLDENAD